MTDLIALTDSHELQVDCRHCGLTLHRSMAWLCGRRDMNCPSCDGVIVLNTSERRRQVSALQRQILALHHQLSRSILSPQSYISPSHPTLATPSGKTNLKLGLRQLYPSKGYRAPRPGGGASFNLHRTTSKV